MSKQIQRFWASRDSSQPFTDVTRLWCGEKPRVDKGWYSRRKNRNHSQRLVIMLTTTFKQLYRFNVPKGRCVEITDPRAKQIRGTK